MGGVWRRTGTGREEEGGHFLRGDSATKGRKSRRAAAAGQQQLGGRVGGGDQLGGIFVLSQRDD